MNGPLKVLIVEDLPADSELAAAVLERSWPQLDWERVETRTGFLEALQRQPDIVIADFDVPGFGAIPALELLRQQGSDIPLIVFTGAVTDHIVEQCKQLGAAQCLLKDQWSLLTPAVSNALERRSSDT